MEWVLENYKWIFSGIGASIIIGIIGIILKKSNKKSIKMKQKSGDNSTSVQFAGSMYNVGVSASEARQIALDIFDANISDILKKSNDFALKRVEYFIGVLNEILNLQKTDINKEYFYTEEGHDLFLKAIYASARTRHEKKLNLYARIIKNSLIYGKQFEEDEPDILLKIVEELSVKELRVVKCIHELHLNKSLDNEDNCTNVTNLISKNYPEFDKDTLVPILVRIEKCGLIKELTGFYVGNEGGIYKTTKLFKQFINFIETFE